MARKYRSWKRESPRSPRAHKVLGKLLTEGLVEEVPAHGAPPICRWIILRWGRPSLSNKMIAERTGLVLQTERQCHGLE